MRNFGTRGSRGWLAIWTTAAILAADAVTWAQTPDALPTRGAALDVARDARVGEVSPPGRTVLERALYWYDTQSVLDRLVRGWHGLHVVGGRFAAGAGSALGVGYTASTRALAVNAEVAGSSRGSARGLLELTARRIGRAPIDVTVHARGSDAPQEDFFGLGMSSRVEDRTNYLLTSVEGGATVTWHAAPGLDVAGGIGYLSPRVGHGTDPLLPSTEETFETAAIPGYLDRDDFLHTDIAVTYDRRDLPRHPHTGGRYGARLATYRDRDRHTFRRTELSAEQYVPLPNRYRTLAVAASAVLTASGDGIDVPFYLQPSLGGASRLRGFREFRFQDRNAVAMTAEYRWEAWWALDGALFVDAGTVASSPGRLRVKDVAVSYGVGLRLHSNSALVTRLDLAFSREGFIPLLRFEHVF
ncbi:MAG: BamA/TamA family outer membrane protein [Vicinamibacterales bacterium]